MNGWSRLVIPIFLVVDVPFAAALDFSQTATGANHASAHHYATGTGIAVGILDAAPSGIREANNLGSRLVDRLDFLGRTPSQTPVGIVNPDDDHEALVADIVAGDHPQFVGVAPQASIIDAAVLEYDSYRAATNWLNGHHQIELFNLSGNYGYNDNGMNDLARYFDWFSRQRDALIINSAGNFYSEILIPADFFNGITVGAINQSVQARWTASAYKIIDPVGGTEVRGKPDILAPGVNVKDGISYAGAARSGTSFAAPHVAGTAALLMGYGSDHPTGDELDHRGIKALVLNSARKRQIIAPEVLSPVSNDSAAANAVFDNDYLACTGGGCTIGNPATASLTPAWTPAGWTLDGGKFSATKPLDDEQGVGFLDATRAIINLAGGNFAPGLVGGIGWDQATIATADAPSAHTYALHQTLAAGSFLTATLAWDRIVNESDADGVVEDDDTYAFGELANLDLRLLNASDQVVAESISAFDNVEHLHVPLPANGNPSDFKLKVVYDGGGVLATDFALAWWTDPTPLAPGDYNLDGTVNALDYDVWRANFAASTATSPLIHGDGNNDGMVNAADYALWRDHLGESWSFLVSGQRTLLASIPEPASIALAGLAVVWLFGFVCCRREDNCAAA